ncbi:zinc finger protein 771-like [Scomber scombrus]|uniref:Zinc finger protein 771-like n=1 Tax=Scomber scombrus TaxID=13677 RepID=A0AAV1P179_SCOSC
MFKIEQLKTLVNERLQAAAEEIFSLFEKTIKDYEEEVFRSKQQTEQHGPLVGRRGNNTTQSGQLQPQRAEEINSSWLSL